MPKKKDPKETRLDLMKAAYLKRASELWDEHIEDAMAFLEDSESRKLTITFPARFDFSEITAKLTTEINFSQVHKDKRVDDFDSPDQVPLLPPDTDFGRKPPPPKLGKGKGKGKKATAKTDEFQPEGEPGDS